MKISETKYHRFIEVGIFEGLFKPKKLSKKIQDKVDKFYEQGFSIVNATDNLYGLMIIMEKRHDK